jgi:hypothetical protein
MTHAEAVARDAADAYVRGVLDQASREAFEAHYFACDECFAEVQAADALRSAVRTAARDGVATSGPSASVGWMLPYAASVLLAAGFGWAAFVERPALQSELTAVRAERDALAQSPAQPSAPAVVATPRAEANVPMAFLEAERGTAAHARILIPAASSQIVLAISAPAADRARLEVRAESHALIAEIDGLTRNERGAYVVTVPAAPLAPGRYRLSLLAGDDRHLMGEYLLEVVRP